MVIYYHEENFSKSNPKVEVEKGKKVLFFVEGQGEFKIGDQDLQMKKGEMLALEEGASVKVEKSSGDAKVFIAHRP